MRGEGGEGDRDGEERERGVTRRGEKREEGRGRGRNAEKLVTSKFAIRGLVVPLIFL